MVQSRDELYAARARSNKVAAAVLITLTVSIMIIFMVLTYNRNADKLSEDQSKATSKETKAEPQTTAQPDTATPVVTDEGKTDQPADARSQE